MDVRTLQDLAEHCYKKWLTTDKISLPSGSIEWIREDLGEQRLSEEVGKIFGAGIQGSEKCYRFLKLTGVIDRARLRKLLKKQVLDEIEYEKVFKIKNLEIDFQNKVNEQRRRLISSPQEGALPTWLLMIIAALVVGGIGILVGSKIGWSIGVLVGAGATFIYRMMRMSELIGQFEREAEPGLDIQRESVESGTRDKKTHIDEAIINLEKLYSGPLVNRDKEENKTVDIITAPDTMRYFMWTASVVLALIIVPAFISIPNTEWGKVQNPIIRTFDQKDIEKFKLLRGENKNGFSYADNGQLLYNDKSFTPSVSADARYTIDFRMTSIKSSNMATAIRADDANKSELYLLDMEKMKSTRIDEGCAASEVYWSPSSKYLVALCSYEGEWFLRYDIENKKIIKTDFLAKLGKRGTMWVIEDHPNWIGTSDILKFTVCETCNPYESTSGSQSCIASNMNDCLAEYNVELSVDSMQLSSKNVQKAELEKQEITVTAIDSDNYGCGNRGGGFEATYRGEKVVISFTIGKVLTDLEICEYPRKKLNFVNKPLNVIGHWNGKNDAGVKNFDATEIYLVGEKRKVWPKVSGDIEYNVTVKKINIGKELKFFLNNKEVAFKDTTPQYNCDRNEGPKRYDSLSVYEIKQGNKIINKEYAEMGIEGRLDGPFEGRWNGSAYETIAKNTGRGSLIYLYWGPNGCMMHYYISFIVKP